MNKNMKAVFAVVLALILIGLSACGGGGGDGGSGNGTTPSGNPSDLQVAPDMSALPESMTPDERDAAAEKVKVYQDAVYSGDIDADNQAVVDYILTLTSEFADAGITPEKTVWARFIDGFPVAFTYITVPVGTTNPALAIQTSQPVALAAATAAEIPQGDKAVLFDIDTLATNSLSTIEPALTKKGYVTSRPKGTVDDFLAINNTSVFFISSHGTPCQAKDGTYSFCVLTNEQHLPYDPTNAHSVNLKLLHDDGEIIVDYVDAHDPNGNLAYTASFIAITEKFVANNWSKSGAKAFTPNSLVVIDTCLLFYDDKLGAGKDKSPYTKFRNALYGAGASTLMGWNDEVGKVFASDTMQLFFDRALGANAFQPESPKQRPFPLRVVHDWLVNSNKQCEGAGACLTLKEHGAPSQLVPTIHNANVYNVAPGEQYAGKWILEIAGEFGSDPGTDVSVTVDGVERPILGSWAHDNLKVELPSSMTGPGSYGDLVVTVRKHPSNAVPLTQWTGTISQSQIDENIGTGAHFDVSCPVQGTGDVHGARTQPALAPLLISVVDVMTAGPCTYTMSGTWSDGSTRWDLSGNGSVSPFATTPVVGSLTSADASGLSGVPTLFQGYSGFVFDPPASGTLRATNLSDGTFVDSTVYSYWGFTGPDVTLGADYGFTANRTCMVTPPQCTETWSLTPSAAPTADTES